MNWYIFTIVLLSVVIFFLIWYIAGILKKLLFISNNIDNLLEVTEEFNNHLQQLYELETFYGEPVLENLIKHSKVVVEEIKMFGEIYSLTEELEEISEEEERIDEEKEEE